MRRSSALQLLLRRSHRLSCALPCSSRVGALCRTARGPGWRRLARRAQQGDGGGSGRPPHLQPRPRRAHADPPLHARLRLPRGASPLRDSLRITDTTRDSHDETWTQPWGEVARVRDHHNELRVAVDETTAPRRRFTVRVRAFDDGIGLPLRGPRAARARRLRDHRRAHRVRPGRQRARLVDPVELRRGSTAPEMLYSSGPVSMLDSVQTPLTMQTRGRPHVHGDPRGEPRGLRADVPRRTAHGEPHCCAPRSRRGGRREGARTHAVRDAVAHDPARRPRRRISRRRCWPQPQSAERARRAPTGSSR